MSSIKTILIVDDTDHVRNSMKIGFELNDFTVITAENGKEGLEALREQGQQIDAVVVDYEMPVMDGAEMIRLARDEGFNLPIVMASSRGSDKQVQQIALKSGADKVLMKDASLGVPDIIAALKEVAASKGGTDLSGKMRDSRLEI